MANPDIVSVGQIYGNTVCKILGATAGVAVVSTVPTDDVYKINSIMCCNVHTSAETVDIKINKVSGDDVFLVKGLSIPVGATLDVLNKPIYLMEGDVLEANGGAATYIHMTVSYEDIS